MSKINAENLFNFSKNLDLLQTIYCYPGAETVTDPFEKTKETRLLNPIPIKVVISQIGFSALHWKYWGQIPTGSIQVLTQKKHKNIMLNAKQIKHKNNFYKVYTDDSQKFQYLEKQDYCVFILGLKND